MSFLKKWYQSQDTQDRINLLINFSSDCFKAVMASLLVIFVPQQCEEHICSVTENVSNLTDFNSFVLAFNFFTLAMFAVLYYVELKREQWLIVKFDHSDKEDDFNLKTLQQLACHDALFQKLDALNQRYFKIYFHLRFVFVLNFLFSMILIYAFYFLDYKSITVLLTNVALCWNKIQKGIQISRQSLQERLAYSFFQVKNISFNVLQNQEQISQV